MPQTVLVVNVEIRFAQIRRTWRGIMPEFGKGAVAAVLAGAAKRYN